MLPGYAMEQLLADTKLSELWDAATKSKQTSHINKTILPSAFCVTFFFVLLKLYNKINNQLTANTTSMIACQRPS